jgi:GDPmannose 4,6-dehydratase
LLLEKGYDVIGIVRRSASDNQTRIEDLKNHKSFKIVSGDITDASFMAELISTYKPDEFYNLAAQSFVGYSFANPVSTFDVNALAVVVILEAIEKFSPKTKFYQASSSEIYGGFADTAPQNELTAFKPQSPYGVAKLAAHGMVRLARDRGVFACAGILFNHESELRGSEFVTQKICEQAVEVAMKKRQYIELGWLGSQRDWGYAPEYVEGMWRMLQQPIADDYVLATGETYTVEDWLTWVCQQLDLPLWIEGRQIVGNDESVLLIDPKFMRPNEVKLLKGDATKAKQVLGWEAEIKGKNLAMLMLGHAMQRSGSHTFLQRGMELINSTLEAVRQ